ncbi:hypothetical protein EMPS_05326 [Entomortierella parvispora]|uniref:Exostosin GT47 domain-containing protein n=1 Tax=Entomortierella parvispora TaxID=205924 RepID=A0A9P3LWD8_9FUNG|nr:hypothetical protein EMPS_05326 [Entomortierella parvispora]
MNHNEFNAKASSQVTAVLRSYWRARRYMYIIPAGLALWTLILTISHISSYDDPEHTLERKGRYDPMSTSTLEQNPTAYKPILLNPLPPQEYTHQWPPNIRKPLCMPKIFVYPDSAKMGEFQVTEVPHMGTNYIAEQILLAQLRDKSSSVYKNYVTENPEEADFFYIPFVGSKYLCDCWFTKGIKGDCDVDELYAKPMMRHIREDYPYWNRTWGRDHIMAHPMDSASNYYKTKDVMANATFLTTIGDKRVTSGVDGRSRRYGDIVIPSATALLNLVEGMVPESYLTADGQPLKGKRDILALFGGRYQDVKPEDSYSAGIRSLLFNGLDQQPDYRFAPNWDNSVYTQLLTQSRYGLAPMGYTLDTTRIWEYIAFGVVPVIIADGIIEPFEDDMDWDSFTVRVRRADAHRLDVILRSISEKEYERKREALWTHGRQALLNKDAWNLIVRSLCRKGQLEGLRTINHDHHIPLESTASV